MTINIEKPALSSAALTFLAKDLRLFIDGKWVGAVSGKTFPVEDPATHRMARKIKAGTIRVNTHNYGDPAWPFGGYKQSGWGREMGKEVMEHYTETKSVAVRL